MLKSKQKRFEYSIRGALQWACTPYLPISLFHGDKEYFPYFLPFCEALFWDA